MQCRVCVCGGGGGDHRDVLSMVKHTCMCRNILEFYCISRIHTLCCIMNNLDSTIEGEGSEDKQ